MVGSMINLDKLSIDYGKNKVIDGLSFNVSSKGLYGIIGRNGSGKSTLSLSMGGVIPDLITANITGKKQIDGKVGLILQNPSAQFLAMTVKEELGGIDLKPYGAEHLESKNVFELSEGEKQKINLIANLTENNDIIILDEPLELLDPFEARRFLNLIKHCLVEKIVLWFDKDNRFLKGTKKNIHLTKSPEPILPEKKKSKIGKEILAADISCTRKNFRLKGKIIVRGNEKIAIIGRNGSGKSTFLKCLAGIVKSKGQIVKGKVSYAPQNPSHTLFEDTVLDELKIGSSYVGEAVRVFDLKPLLKQPPSKLSKGQQKIVSIASSLNSPLILLDEPTTWLDKNNSVKVYNLVNSNKHAMIIATHDKNILKYCDKVLIAEKGRIRECLPIEIERFFQGYLKL